MLPINTDVYCIYFRINGKLEKYQTQPIEWGKRLISYFKFLANMDVGEKRKPQSGASHLQVDSSPVELRFSTITNVLLLESLVIRVIRQQLKSSHAIQTYFPQDITLLRSLLKRKSGLVLFSGPVGSGKTTTIYQLLRERMSQETVQIITMEDPVEIYEANFLQTEVNELAGISYDVLIKSSLRHHPDILMIGEIRDEETARMAIRGALTGHLMIATIHAKDTLGVIARLQELQVTSEQLKQTLIGVVSQRLVPRYCYQCQGDCRPQCSLSPLGTKRAALLEIMSGQVLKEVLTFNEAPQHLVNLNQKLRKAWACGYINEKTYTQFEVI
ncbi:competence type IV pilus ATPase ComGA [Fundicoccus sp. Sow4_D5]|uniref:competence type IV pilus ATPase ComGA n=1 Tax=unclassified Fundicoccus TaxID=2761543 RepID=UPI003F910446